MTIETSHDSVILSALLVAVHTVTTPALLCFGFLVLLTAWSLYHLLLHPLRKVPGPFTERLGLNVWRAWHAWQRDYAWALKELHDRHGPAVRIGPNHVSFISPEAMQTIYAHGGKFTKTPFYLSFIAHKGRPSLFSTIDPHEHSERRRAVASAYSMTSLVALEDCVQPCVEDLVRHIDGQLAQNESKKATKATLDMSKTLHHFAMDVVGELAFGRTFNFTTRNADPDGFLVGVSNLSHFGAVAGMVPWLSGLLLKAQALYYRQPNGTVVANAARERMDERYAAVQRGEIARPDLLSKFMSARHSPKASDGKANQGFTYLDVLQNAVSVIGAGSDTSSATLAAILVFVVSHPSAYKRLQAEIDEAFDEGRIREPVSYADGVKLEYLQACIKEALRLQPPISMDLPRFVPAGGMVVEGVFYPPGTVVSVSAYVYHRSKAIWGPDASDFRPERWLNLDERQRGRLEKNFLSFGGGSRICIGKNLALMEISKVLPSLLRRYHFRFTPRTPDGPHRLPPRAVDGSVGQVSGDGSSSPAPWTCQSTWFLDGHDLFCDVSPRTDVVGELL